MDHSIRKWIETKGKASNKHYFKQIKCTFFLTRVSISPIPLSVYLQYFLRHLIGAFDVSIIIEIARRKFNAFNN